jgi:hypothetical protein
MEEAGGGLMSVYMFTRPAAVTGMDGDGDSLSGASGLRHIDVP